MPPSGAQLRPVRRDDRAGRSLGLRNAASAKLQFARLSRQEIGGCRQLVTLLNKAMVCVEAGTPILQSRHELCAAG